MEVKQQMKFAYCSVLETKCSIGNFCLGVSAFTHLQPKKNDFYTACRESYRYRQRAFVKRHAFRVVQH